MCLTGRDSVAISVLKSTDHVDYLDYLNRAGFSHLSATMMGSPLTLLPPGATPKPAQSPKVQIKKSEPEPKPESESESDDSVCDVVVIAPVGIIHVHPLLWTMRLNVILECLVSLQSPD